MRVVRRLRTTPAAVLAVAIVGTMALPLVATADSSGISCPGRVTTTGDGWQRIAGPAFGTGSEKITAYAVAPKDTALWATNGTSVMRSGDGGCRWTRSFALPGSASAEMPFSSATATILDVVAAKERTYLLLRDTARPYVLVSDESGAAWKVASVPTAQESATEAVLDLAADATGTYAYLLAHVAGGLIRGIGAGDVLYATSDGGSTWAARPVGIVRTTDPGQIVDIAVDPLSGTDVWAATTYGLHFSIDGGQTWLRENASKAENASLTTIAVTHRPGGTAQVVAANESEELVYVRTSDGSWTTINTPGLVSSATGGRTATQVAITTPNGVYELDFDALKWLPVHGRSPLLSRMSTTYTTTPLLYACECGSTESALWTRSPRRGTTRKDPGPDDRGPDGPGYPGFYGCAPDSKQHKEPVAPPASAVETKKEITLDPGTSATVPVRFRVQPRELDLYFLLDSGPRSTYFGCAASQGAAWAADKLAAIRNLRVGAGEYRDFATVDEYNIWANCINQVRENNFVYRRALRIGPVDKTFRNVLGGVQWGGCNGDFAGLTALHQAASGVGKDIAPAGTSPYDIRPRQDAGFNGDAMKVVVHVAGGYFAQPSATYPGASFAEAIAALKAKDIKQIGIHVPYAQKDHTDVSGREPVPDESGADDLRAVAAATGTTSTKAFNCGALVKATVTVGAPLVCTYVDGQGENYSGEPRKAPSQPPMGKQMVDLVTALSDLKPMKLAVLSGEASVKAVKAPARPLDHLLPQTLDYAVTVTCGPKDYGKTRKVELGGHVGADVVATTATVVHCGTPPVPPPPAPERQNAALPETIQHAALPIQAGAVLGNTPPQINPGAQAQAQAQAQGQAQAQAQGGMVGVAVPQEQEQTRLAYADAVGEDPDTQLAMSELPPAREEDVPIWAFLTGAALMTAAAGSVAFRRGHAVATATVRRR